MELMKTNPVRDAILYQQETKSNQSQMLIEELQTLERF